MKKQECKEIDLEITKHREGVSCNNFMEYTCDEDVTKDDTCPIKYFGLLTEKRWAEDHSCDIPCVDCFKKYLKEVFGQVPKYPFTLSADFGTSCNVTLKKEEPLFEGEEEMMDVDITIPLPNGDSIVLHGPISVTFGIDKEGNDCWDGVNGTEPLRHVAKKIVRYEQRTKYIARTFYNGQETTREYYDTAESILEAYNDEIEKRGFLRGRADKE